MKESPIISQTQGVHAQIESSKVPYTDNGLQYLNYAVNVDITDGGKILRRRGYTATTHTDSAHSIYAYNGKGYCVLGTDLYMLDQGLNKYGVRHNFSSRRVRYQGVGDKVYYSNGVLNGYIKAGVSHPWQPDSYVGPDEDVEGLKITAPPVGRHLALYKGRMFISENNVLWYTAPFWYDGLNRATDFIPFRATIIMVLTLDNALLVGTEEEVFIISGATPDEFSIRTLLRKRVIEDTGVAAEGLGVKESTIPGKTAVFTTQEGIYAVTNSGELFDITGNRLILPDSVSGSAYIKDNFYTVLIDE